MLSDSTAVAATNERFQPSPSPNRATMLAGTLVIHSRLIVETAISSSPSISAGVRPIGSTRSPTTMIRPNIPMTWAPMIGNTLSAAWW